MFINFLKSKKMFINFYDNIRVLKNKNKKKKTKQKNRK